MIEVVIIGAGYAGVIAANRLAGDGSVRVTLVNPSDRFVQRIRLHEFSAGSATSAEVPLASVVNPTITVIEAAASTIDAEARIVRLNTGDDLTFDYLVYAVGSGDVASDDPTHTASTVAGAARLRARLSELPDAATVEVIGAGLTGVEIVTEIAEQHPRLTVSLRTTGQVAPSVSARGRRHINATLTRLGIQLFENSATDSTADVVVRCTGFGAPPLAADSGLPVDKDRRLIVDETLRVPGAERIFGAGDGAVIDAPGFAYHRMACASALPMGGQVAKSILALVRGDEPAPHSAGYAAQCISLGRRDALVQVVRRDDTPVNFVVTGRVGAWVKEAICRQTVKWMRGEARRPGSYAWLKGPRSLADTRAEPAKVSA